MSEFEDELRAHRHTLLRAENAERRISELEAQCAAMREAVELVQQIFKRDLNEALARAEKAEVERDEWRIAAEYPESGHGVRPWVRAVQKARAQALEEAARAAKSSNFVDGPKGTIEGQIAAAIRALASESAPIQRPDDKHHDDNGAQAPGPVPEPVPGHAEEAEHHQDNEDGQDEPERGHAAQAWEPCPDCGVAHGERHVAKCPRAVFSWSCNYCRMAGFSAHGLERFKTAQECAGAFGKHLQTIHGMKETP